MSAQSCLTLCNPMDCRLSGSAVHEILQAGLQEWVAISSSRGSSQPRDCTCISVLPTLAGRLFTINSHLEALLFSSPGDLPNPWIEPGYTALQADSLPSEPPRKPVNLFYLNLNNRPAQRT